MKLRSGKIITASSNSTKIQNNSMKKAKERKKMCMCMPQRFGPVEIPWVWPEFRRNTQLCDGTVICDDDVEIKVHRLILSSVSSYFKAHFTNSLNVGASEIVEAKVDVPSHIFTKLLDFAYTGHCTIDEDNVELLLRAADQYNVLGVIPLCCKYIGDRLQPTDCLGILRLARHYSCFGLEKEAKRYVAHNFVKVLSEGDEFGKLTIEEVIEILEDDDLNVRKEEFVYDAVRRWINVSPHERKVYLLSLLKCIRIPKLSIEFLTNDVLAWSLVAENMDCQSYVMGIMNVDIDNPVWRPRVPYDIVFAIGGGTSVSTTHPTNFIETYDIRADRWLVSEDTDNVPRVDHGVCALNGYIYVIGGSDGNANLNTVRCFNPVNHEWSECACMYYPRLGASVVMHNNKIYAIGGSNGRTTMNSAERYDPRYNQWEFIKPMQI